MGHNMAFFEDLNGQGRNLSVIRRTTMKHPVLAFVAVFSALALQTAPAWADDDPVPYIAVTGVGAASAKPDTALVSLGVLSEADTAAEAADANTKAMSKVLSALRAEGVDDKDIKTSNFSIRPRYRRPKRQSDGRQPPPQIVGYAVSNDLAVRIRELSKTGMLLDRAISQGANKVGNIAFTVDQPAGLLTAARRDAMKDAIAKAKTLADAAGIALGKILEIREGAVAPRPHMRTDARMMMAQAETEVPISAGENKYTVNVTVRWALVQ